MERVLFFIISLAAIVSCEKGETQPKVRPTEKTAAIIKVFNGTFKGEHEEYPGIVRTVQFTIKPLAEYQIIKDYYGNEIPAYGIGTFRSFVIDVNGAKPDSCFFSANGDLSTVTFYPFSGGDPRFRYIHQASHEYGYQPESPTAFKLAEYNYYYECKKQ